MKHTKLNAALAAYFAYVVRSVRSLQLKILNPKLISYRINLKVPEGAVIDPIQDKHVKRQQDQRHLCRPAC